MKRVLCICAALMVAAVAFAGTTADMTPQQAMEKMMNCPVCSVWGMDPAVGPNIRHDISPTKNGYVDVFMTADEKTMPAFQKAHADCENRCMNVPKMTADDKAKLCDCCKAMTALMARKDVSFEESQTAMGWVTVATASTPEGVKALHDYAALSKNITGLLMQAGADMNKEPVKSKM
jgi:hypothetical protein